MLKLVVLQIVICIPIPLSVKYLEFTDGTTMQNIRLSSW